MIKFKSASFSLTKALTLVAIFNAVIYADPVIDPGLDNFSSIFEQHRIAGGELDQFMMSELNTQEPNTVFCTSNPVNREFTLVAYGSGKTHIRGYFPGNYGLGLVGPFEDYLSSPDMSECKSAKPNPEDPTEVYLGCNTADSSYLKKLRTEEISLVEAEKLKLHYKKGASMFPIQFIRTITRINKPPSPNTSSDFYALIDDGGFFYTCGFIQGENLYCQQQTILLDNKQFRSANVEALLGNTQNLCVLEEEDNQTSMRVLTIPCYFSPVGSVEQIPDPSELTVQVTTNVLNFNSSKPMTVKVSLKNLSCYVFVTGCDLGYCDVESKPWKLMLWDLCSNPIQIAPKVSRQLYHGAYKFRIFPHDQMDSIVMLSADSWSIKVINWITRKELVSYWHGWTKPVISGCMSGDTLLVFQYSNGYSDPSVLQGPYEIKVTSIKLKMNTCSTHYTTQMSSSPPIICKDGQIVACPSDTILYPVQGSSSTEKYCDVPNQCNSSTNYAGSYSDLESCFPCHDETKCIQCTGPFMFQCTMCTMGYYLNTVDKMCKSCHMNCYGCTGPYANNCQSCSYYSAGATTTSAGNNVCCPEDQYFDTIYNDCKPCHSNCTGCTGPSFKNCLSCIATTFWLQSLRVCCSFNQFYDSASDSCKSCHSNCYGCTGPFANNCQSCSNYSAGATYTSNGENNICCLQNQYFDTVSNECKECHSSCYSCSGPGLECTMCSNGGQPPNCCNYGEHFDNLSTSCVGSCPTGTYSQNYQCFLCHAFCSDCFGGLSSECYQCNSPYQLMNSYTCASSVSCSGNQFYNGSVCQDCPANCNSCTGLQPVQCSLCQVSYFLDPTLGCTQNCSSGRYANTASNQCEPCHENCLICSGASVNQCSACKVGFYLNQSTCGSTCPDGKYPASPQNQCIDCDPTCLTCSSFPQNCGLCSANYEKLSGQLNKCFPICFVNQYRVNTTCQNCGANCGSCSEPGDDKCLSCSESFYHKKESKNAILGSCITYEQCPTEYGYTLGYSTTQQCVKCGLNCKICTFDQMICDTCEDGFTKLNAYDESCVAQGQTCHNSCLSCDGILPTDCLTCSGTNILKLDTQSSIKGTCVSTCPTQQWYTLSGVQKKCIPCSPNCQLCSDSTPHSCSHCSIGFFKGSNSTCDPCMSSCRTCSSGGITNCLTCPSGFYLKADTLSSEGQCILEAECPIIDGYFKDTNSNKCLKCYQTCKTCSGDKADQCLTCSGALIRFNGSSFTSTTLENTQCLQICPDQFFSTLVQVSGNPNLNLPSCILCHSTCATCTIGPGANHCRTCRQNKFRYTGSILNPDVQVEEGVFCVDTCEAGFFQKDMIIKINTQETFPSCQKFFCHGSCLTCSDETANPEKCRLCQPYLSRFPVPKTATLNSNLVDVKCLAICEDGFMAKEISSMSTCVACHSLCKTCEVEADETRCNSCWLDRSSKHLLKSHEYFPYGECVQECPSKYYSLANTEVCFPCSTNCETCKGGAANKCLTCNPGALFTMAENLNIGTCTLNCETGYYKSDASNCLKCDASCGTCSGQGPSKCTSCPNDGYILPVAKPFGTYEGTCVPCDLPDQYKLSISPNVCLPCEKTVFGGITNCKNCSFNQSSGGILPECTECKDQQNPHHEPPSGKYLSIDKKQCLLSCPDGQYSDNWRRCQPCDSTCAICDNTKKCTRCQNQTTHEIGVNNKEKCHPIISEHLKILSRSKQEGTSKSQTQVEIYIEFDKELSMNEAISKKEVKISIAQKGVEFTDYRDMLMKVVDKKKLVISFTLNSKLEDATMTIQTDKIESVPVLVPFETTHPEYNERREKKIRLADPQIIVPNINLFFSGNPETIAKGAQTASTTISVLTLAIGGANPATAISMVKVMQCMDLFKIINIPKLPANFRAFLDLFKDNMFDIMPNVFSRAETDEDASTTASSGSRRLQTAESTSDDFSWDFGDVKSNNKFCNLNPKFVSVDLNCLLLNNSGEIGFMLLLMLAVKAILKMLVTCISRKRAQEHEQEQLQNEALAQPAPVQTLTKEIKSLQKGKKTKSTTQETQPDVGAIQKIKKVESFFGFAMLIDTIMAIQTDVMVASLINVKYFWIKPFILWLNSTLALVIVIFYFWLVQLMARRSYQLEKLHASKDMSKEDKRSYIEVNKLQKWKFLKGELVSKRTILAGMTTELLMVKELLVAFFIVMFVELPALQIVPALLLFLLAFVHVLRNKVFKSKIVYYTCLLNEATFCIVTFVFFLYYLFGGSMSMNARYNYFGWGLISLILVTVLCNVILGTVGGYYTIKELCCKKKNEKQVADKKQLKKKITGEESSIALPAEKKLKKTGSKNGVSLKSAKSKATNEADISANNNLLQKEESTLKKKSKSRLDSGNSSSKSVPKRIKLEGKKSALDLAIEKKKMSEQSSSSVAGKSRASTKQEKPIDVKLRKVKVSPPQEQSNHAQARLFQQHTTLTFNHQQANRDRSQPSHLSNELERT